MPTEDNARKSLLSIVTIAALALIVPSAIAQSSVQKSTHTSAQPTTQPSTQTTTETHPSPAEQTIFQLANQARSQNKLPPLRWDNALAKAAHAHLQWVIRNPGELLHQYPGEPDLATRGAAAEAHFSTISENIAGHGDTPESLHQIWMNTPTHRANLLNPNLDVIGIAVAESKGFLYAVEDFARDVPVLSFEAVERQVSKLLQAEGLSPATSNNDARITCTMAHGQSGTPRLVIQWDTADFSQLPDVILQQIDQTKYSSAAVGVCQGKPSNPQFTTYHIAVLFY
jgi:uncharacterized protein YkwD